MPVTYARTRRRWLSESCVNAMLLFLISRVPCIYTVGASVRVRLIRWVDPYWAAIAKIPHWLPSGTNPENLAKIGFCRLRGIFVERINSKSRSEYHVQATFRISFSANLLKLLIPDSSVFGSKIMDRHYLFVGKFLYWLKWLEISSC